MRLAIQAVGFRRIYLLNSLIIFYLIKPSADDPFLLIAGGHSSKAKNVCVVDKARERSVATVSLPPHLM